MEEFSFLWQGGIYSNCEVNYEDSSVLTVSISVVVK